MTTATTDVNPAFPTPIDPEADVHALLGQLPARASGLTAREATRRLTQFGPNEIRREVPQRRLRGFVSQLLDPLALLLSTPQRCP